MLKFQLGDRPNSEASATYLRVLAANYHCNLYKDNIKRGRETGEPVYLSLVIEFSSAMFELMAAFDLLLQELNIYYDTGIPIEKVTLNELKAKIEKRRKDDKIIKSVNEEMEKEWLKELKEIRNYIMHRGLVEPADFTGLAIDLERIPAPKELEKYSNMSSLIEDKRNKMESFVNKVQGEIYKETFKNRFS